MTLPALPETAYTESRINLAFRPESQDGLIFFTGADEGEGKGDFIAFGLELGFAVLRFDVGNGPAVVRSSQALSLGEWHRVKIHRKNNDGLNFFFFLGSNFQILRKNFTKRKKNV